jgi:predicted amidohydrolase YtcJ
MVIIASKELASMNVIFYNCSIYPQYRIRRRPTAIVVSGNRIAAVGDNLSITRSQYPKYRQVNLDGRAVIPGLVDSHTHFHLWAATLDTVHLDGTRTFDEALGKIKKFSPGCGPDDWVIGDGWSADRWEEYHLPTAAELDSVTGGRPAALFSKDQHILWVNSQALQMAGIDENYPEPDGGKVDREPGSNRPTGILREVPGYFPIIKLISRPDMKRMDKSWKKAARVVYARGVTGFHTMDGPEAWDYFQRLHQLKRLGFRVHYYFPVALLDELIEKKIVSGLGDDTLQIGGVKIFSDGSLGAQTALMKKPYQGKRNGHGVEVTGRRELKRMVAKAAGAGLSCAIHAIGDRAVDNVISAYESIPQNRSLRQRIEHLQIISRGNIKRLKKVGAIASMQPSHCPSDRELIAAYWGRRGRNAYIFKTLLKKNIPLAFGSDCPIEPLDPLAGIHAAVNRNGYGERGGRFYPEERLTVSQAVYGFTAGAAYASGRESYSGKIAPGYQADLVILDDNIYTMLPSRLYSARVAATIFDGRVVYHNDSIKGIS